MTEIILQTSRLTISPLRLSDAAFIVEILNEPAFIKFIGDRNVRDINGAKLYLLKGPLTSYKTLGFGLWRVALSSTGEPIGMCGLIKRDVLPDVDLGYAYLTRYWGYGYASEAALAVRDYARKVLGIKRLLGITDQRNSASIRVLEKIGMRLEGHVTMPGETEELNLFGMELQPA